MCSKTECERQGIDTKTPIALEKHGITAGRVLGKGCYSCVIMGLSNFGPVAVKVIDLQRVSRTIISKNIPREIECIRSLNHPNIIKYIQHIKSEYCVYIVMEFAENGCVLDFLNAQENIGEVQSRRWFKQLLDAVTYCHARGVVHRDIKCDNLLLGRNNKLKLADFGFARAHMREQDVSETYCGSPIYTAPEVLLESPYAPHYSDIWSMGVVLFCFLYGRLPFTEQTYRRVIRQVQCKVIFPKSVFVSTACKHVLEKMIAPLRRRCYLPELTNDPWVLSGPTRSSDSVASISSNGSSKNI